MIISPPFIRAKNNNENDAHWIERMMPVEPDRDYPINYGGSWHGGIHVRHTNSDRQPEYVRAIADGVVVSIRNPSDQAACIFRRSIIMEAQTMGMFCFVMKLK